ncbi:MAG: hypothetical protein AB7V77_03670 [Candidatus Woesearchaeota archaeon]
MSESVFVRIDNVNDKRIILLESSKLTLQCLQIQQKILDLRNQKSEEFKQLKSQIKELTFLTSKLQEKFPHIEFLEKEIKPSKVVQTKKTKKNMSKQKIEVKAIKQISKSDKIEMALAEIEKKLKSLN